MEMVREFEGRSLRVRPWRGRMWVEARNLGQVLGYGDPGEVLRVIDRHAEDFEDGIDVVKVVGADLAEWKAVDIPSDCPDVDRTARLTLLSETAARMVAMLARTPDATRVRRWLAGVWAEIARTGSYVAPTAPAAPEPQLEPAGLRQDLFFGPMPAMVRATEAWLRSEAHPPGFRPEQFTAADVLRHGFGMTPTHGTSVTVGKILARLGLPSRVCHHARVWTTVGWSGSTAALARPSSAQLPEEALSLLTHGERSALAMAFVEKGRAAVLTGDRARAQLVFDAVLRTMG